MCSVKKDVLKYFAIFTGKHLCWSLFLIKLQDFRPEGSLCWKRKFSFLSYQTSNSVRGKYPSQFSQSSFPLAEHTSNLLVSWNYGFYNFIYSSKESLFPKDPLPTKFFYGEVVKEEELGRGSFRSTYKARFNGDTVAIK